MEKTIVTSGKSIDLAIESALNQLGLDRDSVSVQVISQAKSVVYLHAGTVSGGAYVEGTERSNGGNFYCGPGAQVNMYGGLVTGGSVPNNGGNFYIVDSGVTKINFSGGIIENGTWAPAAAKLMKAAFEKSKNINALSI